MEAMGSLLRRLLVLGSLVGLMPGCMGLWYAERRLTPAPLQATEPGPAVSRFNGHEAIVLVEHDTAVVRLMRRDGAAIAGLGSLVVTARLDSRPELTIIGWGPILPVLPCWLISVPDRLVRPERPGKVRATITARWGWASSEWPPTLTAEPRDLALVHDGRAVRPERVTAGREAVEAVFQVPDRMTPWQLEVRRLRVGTRVIEDIAPARFEPDFALTWWICP